MNHKVLIQLANFRNLKENNQLNSIAPDDPLYVIRYISKNKNYLNTLDELAANHYHLVLSFVQELQSKIWDLDLIAHTQVTYPKQGFNNGFDLVYIAYLSELISREFFYDFIVFQTTVQSFSGMPTQFKNRNNVMVQVPSLPKAGNVKKHTSNGQAQSPVVTRYIAKVKQKLIEAGKFCFSNDQFTHCLLETAGYCLFEIQLNYSLFQSLTSVAPHDIWFDLFLHSAKYALMQTAINATANEISFFIPGEALLNAFVVGISPESSTVFKRIYAFGLISGTEELRLHQSGYHLASLLDDRFKSLVQLHGRTGNAWESLLHDTLFHSVAISSHPEYIRRIFYKMYERFNSISNPQSELLTVIDDSPPISQQLLTEVLNELKSRCIELGDIFGRRSEDYIVHDYYFRESLKALLIGTTYQIVSQQAETVFDVIVLENKVKRILFRCCLYLNDNPSSDVPTISHDVLHQFFLTPIFKRELIMKKNTVFEFAEKEKIRLQEELLQVKTQKTSLQKLGPAKNKITELVEAEITRIEKELDVVSKQIDALIELAVNNEEDEQQIPTPGATSIFAKEPSKSIRYSIVNSPDLKD